METRQRAALQARHGWWFWNVPDERSGGEDGHSLSHVWEAWGQRCLSRWAWRSRLAAHFCTAGPPEQWDQASCRGAAQAPAGLRPDTFSLGLQVSSVSHLGFGSLALSQNSLVPPGLMCLHNLSGEVELFKGILSSSSVSYGGPTFQDPEGELYPSGVPRLRSMLQMLTA